MADVDGFMNNRETFSALCNERNLWSYYPVNGDAKRPARNTVIRKIGQLMAAKERADPFMYKKVVSALNSGIATPEDYLEQLHISWSELTKGL